MKVRKSLKTLLQSAQVTRYRRCRNSTGEPPVWDRQYLMNPAGPVTGIPGLFFPLPLRPEGCGSHDTVLGRGLKRGVGGAGQEAVKVT